MLLVIAFLKASGKGLVVADCAEWQAVRR